MKLILLLFTFIIQSAIADEKIQATVGIVNAKYGEIPGCSRVLIRRDIVLTAAHCITVIEVDGFTWVQFGEEASFRTNVARIIGYCPKTVVRS